jgi:MFS family permease
VAKRSYSPPWLFCLSCIPYGVVGSFQATVMPFLAEREGLSLGSIGWLTVAVMIPTWVQFVYAPIVDVGFKRKHWLVIMSAISACFLMATCHVSITDHRGAFIALAITAQFLSGLVSSCNGGLMSVTIPDELRGRAGAWYNVGNLSGGAVAGGLAVWLIQHDYDAWTYGGVLALTMFLPSLAILWVDEPERDHVEHLRDLVGTTVRDVRDVLSTRRGVTGALLFLSPVATAALLNSFAGMTDDYHASDFTVWVVNGWANGILTALGALAGGYLCDRYSRRGVYLLSGLLTAICGVAMMLSPRTDLTYTWGVMTYFLVAGVCYAATSATLLETIGDAGKAASTQYALFNACGNIAISWVGLVETRFHDRWHVEGVLAADAALNVIGVVILGIVFWRMGVLRSRRGHRVPESAPAA